MLPHRARGPIAFAAIVLVFLAAAGMAQRGPSADVSRTYELPSQRILTIGSHIVRFDTQTGAIFRLRGEPTVTTSGQDWSQRVPAVTGPTSGMLDIVQMRGSSADGTFLVDVAGSRTWILRWRGNEDGIWQPVEVR
ncbi:MAG: hypothetical protein ACYTJ0_09505 [Planctomycetota bacterium]|jgi:hypothetical protein